MITALLILLCGVADRMRGFHWRVMSFPYGLAVGYLIGIDEWEWLIPFALLWWLGASFGWGEPLGSFFNRRFQRIEFTEWWQVGGLQDPGEEFAAVIVRGFMWGLCTIPLGIWYDGVVVFPMLTALSFTMAVPISRQLSKVVNQEGWATMEFTRGILMGISAFSLGWFNQVLPHG